MFSPQRHCGSGVDRVDRAYSFDVAFVGAEIAGRSDRRRWVRVVVSADRLVDAHLTAAQIVARRGMVTDVLYRE